MLWHTVHLNRSGFEAIVLLYIAIGSLNGNARHSTPEEGRGYRRKKDSMGFIQEMRRVRDGLGNAIASSSLPHGVSRPAEGKWRLEMPNLYGM